MEKKTEPNFSKEYTLQFKHFLVQLFALPIQRTTIRDFHSNLARFVGNDEALLKTFMESFMKGGLPVEYQSKEHLRDLIEEYSPLVRLAKDIHDRGDFLNFVTSDQVTYQDRVVFHHYLRVTDGREMRFVTDIPTIVQLIQHLSQRLAEASSVEIAHKSLEEMKPLMKDAQEKLARAVQMAN